MNETNTMPLQTATTAVRASGHVFISYKSQQASEADRLQRYIESKGYSCWRAPGSLHKRGTQDYSSDIFQAIREAKCLLFVLSDAALGSDWVQREVNYALNTCHKPVIPFVIDRIPEAKKESNGVYISLQLEKQILNEELSWNMDVILPYLEKAFGSDLQGGEAQQRKKELEPRHCLQAEWSLWSKTAEFHLARLEELKKMDILRPAPTDLTPEAREMEFRFSTNEVAGALINILTTIPVDANEWEKMQIPSIQRQAVKNLAKLTYDYGGRFSPFVYACAQPFAEAGVPWANFVMHAKFYLSEDVLTARNDDDFSGKAFPYLQKAVLDVENPWAFLRMGELWQWGTGCEVSGGQARFWYERAAQLDCPEAFFCLARLYKYAPAGIKKDISKAKEYAGKGANAGNARAYWLLGELSMDQYWSTVDDDIKKSSLKQAEQYYVQAYEKGWPRALDELGWIRLLDEDYKYEDDRFGDFQCLCYTMKRAKIRGANALLARNALYKDRVDVAAKFALAGFRNAEPEAVDTYAGLLVWDQCKKLSSKSPVAWRPVFDWIEAKMSESAKVALAPFAGFLADKDVKAPQEWNWNQYDSEPPKTAFWKLLVDGKDSVSTIKKEKLVPAAKFLSILWNLPVSDANSEFAEVKDIWELVRLLDWELETAEILDKGAADAFPPEFFDDSGRRQKRIFDILLSRMDRIPDAPAFCQRLKTKFAECEGGEDLPLAKINKDDLAQLREELHKHLASGEKFPSPLTVAVRLGEIERLVSPPVFAAAMTFCRKAFDCGGASDFASHFANLFIVLNARHFDQNRNEGMLFGLRDILFKSILLGDPSCVPLYLELCLLGLRVGKSRLESDFSLIEKLEPHLFELVEDDSCNAKTTAEIAFVMGKIYEDKDLFHMARVESWGHVSLYDPTKACIWFEIAAKRAREANLLAIEKLARDKCKLLSDDLGGLAGTINESSTPDMAELLASTPDMAELWPPTIISRKAKAIQDLVNRVPENIDGMAFKHVHLEGENIDFVVSSDSVAVLFAVYPEGEDFVARPRENGNEDSDSVDSNGLSPAKLDMLEKQRESLQKMEPDSELHLAVIASTQTLESMRVVWENDLEEKKIELVEYADFEIFLQKYFSLLDAKETNGEDDAEDGEPVDSQEIG